MTKPSSENKFQLTYLTFTDNQKMLGHSCVGITQVMPNGERELLFRTGLFPTNQVEIEDFIKNKPGRNFKERSFDINKEQLAMVLHQINYDRSADSPKAPNKPRQPEAKETLSNGEQSIPMGPKYDYLKNNCKDYALSLVRAAGIDDKPLRNFGGISIPFMSGKMNKVILSVKDKKSNVLVLTKPEGIRDFINKMLNKVGDLTASFKNKKNEWQQAMKSRNQVTTNNEEMYAPRDDSKFKP